MYYNKKIFFIKNLFNTVIFFHHLEIFFNFNNLKFIVIFSKFSPMFDVVDTIQIYLRFQHFIFDFLTPQQSFLTEYNCHKKKIFHLKFYHKIEEQYARCILNVILLRKSYLKIVF